MPNQSKYTVIKQTRVPRKKRTIKVYGSGDDDGKWYRCWHCGFINNIDRNIVGDGEGLAYQITIDGVTYPVADPSPSSMVNYTYGDGTYFGDGSIDGSGTNYAPGALQTFVGVTGKAGVTTSYMSVESVAVSGCSFCGCKNYR